MSSTDPAVAGEAPLHFVMAYVFRQRDPEMGGLVTLLARSILALYPRAEVVLLTNALGAESGVGSIVRLQTRELDPNHVMVERLREYRDYVRSVVPGTVVVFLDTDMLVMRRFDELLAPGANLAVTHRRFAAMPINAGLIVARTEAHAEVCRFFDRLHAVCADLPEEEKRWYGDQVALARLLAPPRAGRYQTVTAEREGLSVRFAPGRLYNRTPRPWMLRLGLYPLFTRILHFKGDRKARMPLYARRYLKLFQSDERAAKR
ncbi:hypothetical protein GCM10011390_06130 [Aureimonas endophytica]|uniref:Nucleotide-diphospho-sugar transferase n=1 Tax=Aureimonas endophytica TaxID=2027858 RepID=A0A916ZDZ9_9HYPH|nr:hypothetical protein [Aureimonas endophytica]GGD90080.1 hypothetical protein GCM10011390_06130 [Aureimonas endophytica]